MNQLLEWLKGGDLRSDGLSMEVVRFVLEQPGLLPDLLQGLLNEDEVIRGRSADAIEHLARELPSEFRGHQTLLSDAMIKDPTPMVRWHMAMVLGHMALDWDEPAQACGHMALDWDEPAQACELLMDCLSDRSVFVVSWVIVSLCIYARLFPALHGQVITQVAACSANPSAAIRSKVKNATKILRDHDHPFPRGWVKSSKILRALES
jgi:hypothetical protein